MGGNIKIGIFGGTFDPIHFGHLNLMVELKEKCHLDHVLLCPARVSPAKQNKPSAATSEHRLKMVKLAIEEIPWAEVTEVEMKRLPPSYMIETVEYIQQQKKGHLYLLIAEDVAYTVGFWKEPEKLLGLASPLVGTRNGFDSGRLENVSPFVKSKLEKGHIPIFPMDISSTRLRDRLKNKLYCGHLIPSKVLDYIYENGLYYSL